MSTDIDVPAVGKVDRKYVYAGGALVVGIVGYAWFKNRGAAPAEEFGPPLPEVSATDYVNPQGYGNSTQTVDTTGDDDDDIDTNAKWTQKSVELLTMVGFDPMMVTNALGKYLQRQPLTAIEKGAVIAARATVGDPPVGGPYPMTDALPTPNPSPNPTPSTWKGPVLRKHDPNGGTISIKTLGAPGSAWTWAQLVPMFYSNPPPPGPLMTVAAAQLRLANAKRLLFKGTYKWGTYPTATPVTVPAKLFV